MTHTRPKGWLASLMLAAVLSALLAACGGAPATSGEPKLVAATFAKKLGENQEPVGETKEFYPDETVYLSLKFDGRPQKGVVTSEFFWGDESIANAKVDFAGVNSGLIFSVGQSTFAGFNLTHEKPLPVSGNYRVVSTLDGKELGTYEFAVVPPADAIPTKISEATLALGHDEDFNPQDPTDTFTTQDEVFLVGSGNFGQGTWLKAEWLVNGELDESGSKTIGPFEENVKGSGFAFSFLPKGEWKEGDHEVVLYVNDKEHKRYTFTVAAPEPTAEPTEEPVAEPTAEPVAGGTVEFGTLTEFSPDSGLFTIKVPEGWEADDSSSDGIASYSWIAPSETAGVIINITGQDGELSEDELSAKGEEFVNGAFGDETDFEILETTPQSDGSVLVAWKASPDINGEATSVVGLTYIEQRGDKLSLLTAVMPFDDYDALWEAGFNEIVNSYKVDDSVPLE